MPNLVFFKPPNHIYHQWIQCTLHLGTEWLPARAFLNCYLFDQLQVFLDVSGWAALQLNSSLAINNYTTCSQSQFENHTDIHVNVVSALCGRYVRSQPNTQMRVNNFFLLYRFAVDCIFLVILPTITSSLQQTETINKRISHFSGLFHYV